jgi:hypothetical protein
MAKMASYAVPSVDSIIKILRGYRKKVTIKIIKSQGLLQVFTSHKSSLKSEKDWLLSYKSIDLSPKSKECSI